MEQPLNPGVEAAHERWFGSQAAAAYLGIHRSTLFHAMRREHLIPDGHTPGGFARFRQSTLEAFRRRISEEAATGTGPIYAPIHTLAQLAHEVKDMAPVWGQRHHFLLEKELPNEVKEVCESAISAVSKPPVQARKRLLALRTFDPYNAYGLKTVAQAGIDPSFFRDYIMLRSQPQTQFVTDETLAYGKEAYCPNTQHDLSPFNGSRQFIKAQGIGSYLALPISSGELTLGLLLLFDNEPREFNQHERAFLKGITDQVALAISAYARAVRLDTYAQAGQQLTQSGLEAQARLRGITCEADRLQAQRAAIAELLKVFKAGSNADCAYVLNLPGIETPADVSPELSRLTAYALSESQPGERRPQLAARSHDFSHKYSKDEKGLCVGKWQTHGRYYSGLALGITVPPATPAAVGAAWRCFTLPGAASDAASLTPVTPEDHALLVSLAGACALVMAAI